MVLAISAAEPMKVRGGGCVESVVTPRTHFRFLEPRRIRAVLEVDGIDLVQSRSAVASQPYGRNVLAGSDRGSKHHAGSSPWRA